MRWVPSTGGVLVGCSAGRRLLLVHAVLQTKTTELIDSLEMASVKFLNAITERQAAPAAA